MHKENVFIINCLISLSAIITAVFVWFYTKSLIISSLSALFWFTLINSTKDEKEWWIESEGAGRTKRKEKPKRLVYHAMIDGVPCGHNHRLSSAARKCALHTGKGKRVSVEDKFI